MSVYLVASDVTDGDNPTLFRLPFNLYPDNSPVLSMQGGLPNYGDGFLPCGMMVKYTTYQEFIAAMMLAHRLNNGPSNRPVVTTLYLPYVPAARQDKPRPFNGYGLDRPTGDVLATLDFTVQLVKLAGFKHVIVMDAHSKETERAFEEAGVRVSHSDPDIPRIFAQEINSTYRGVIAPDKGATDRALAMAIELGVPLYTASKVRNPQTNELTGFRVNHLHPFEHYLVVDDICDGGGTFLGLAEEIIISDASADLFVTHGLFTNNAGERLKRKFGQVYTTDSLGHNADHVITIPMVDQCMQLDDAEYLTIEEGKR